MIRFEGVFAPLADRAAFEQVSLHPELKVVYWPNGADLDPDVLYARVAGTGVPSFKKRSVRHSAVEKRIPLFSFR